MPRPTMGFEPHDPSETLPGGNDLPADPEAVDRLVHGVKEEEVPNVLLDVLARSRVRAVRRRAFDRLVKLGPEAGRAVAERLASVEQPWYVLRNLLSLMRELQEWPGTWSVSTFTSHRHAAVRREALQIMLRMPRRREWALSRLLEEKDPKSLSLGLTAALEDPPPDAFPLLLGLAEDETLDTHHRRLAVRALASTGVPEVSEALLDLATAAPGWYDRLLRRPRLAGKSPVVVEALACLQRGWPEDPRVNRVLRRAAVDLDGQVRRASSGKSSG